MAEYTYDLHFHSCLSPCGSDDMTPAMLAGLCAAAGIQIAALTDHNSCENCKAFLEACNHYGILGIPGMELTTAEEVHVVCLFRNLKDAMAFSDYVKTTLPNQENKKDIFGNQFVMDCEDNVLFENTCLLAAASSIGIYDVCDLVRKYDGVAFPAHIDRPSFSLLSNMGLWDASMGFTFAELSRNAELSQMPDVPYIVDSDAHYMNQIMEPHQRIELNEFNPDCLIDKLLSIR